MNKKYVLIFGVHIGLNSNFKPISEYSAYGEYEYELTIEEVTFLKLKYGIEIANCSPKYSVVWFGHFFLSLKEIADILNEPRPLNE